VTVLRPTKAFRKLKDVNYENTQNQNNNCPLYQRKWWKWWVKDLNIKFDFNKDEFVDFCLSTYPYVLMEFKLLGGGKGSDSITVSASASPSVTPSRPTPTPNPTGGALRTSIL